MIDSQILQLLHDLDHLDVECAKLRKQLRILRNERSSLLDNLTNCVWQSNNPPRFLKIDLAALRHAADHNPSTITEIER